MTYVQQKNKLTSPEEIEKISKENQRLVKDFLDYLASVGRSDTTCYSYKNDLDIFFVWNYANNDNKFFVDLTKRDVMRFQNWLLNENGNSPARVRRLKATLSSLSNFVMNVLDDEYPTFRNIINSIESPANQRVKEKAVLSDDEYDALLQKLADMGKYDQACFLALGMYSGRRKSELCRFKVSDFDEDHLICGGALYKSDPIKTKGRGKGKFIPCYTLAKPFQPYLDRYLEYREEKGYKGDYLFPNKKDPNKPITTRTIDNWFSVYKEITGTNIHPHALRHRFTTALVKAGIPDAVIQNIISWESRDMIKVYTDIDVDEQLSMYFNEEGIVIPEKKNLSDL